MSLMSALQTGRSGLMANQLALEVTGNNLANAATVGYSRQNAIAVAAPGIEVQQGVHIGTGVRIETIQRHIDEALNTRLRAAIGDQSAAETQQNVMGQIESIHNELTDQGLLSRMDRFFNTWSELANNPTENGLRSLVIAEGGSLASFFHNVRDDLVGLRQQTDSALDASAVEAESLLERIGMINGEIAVAEGGMGGANALRDQRDKLLTELAEYFEITTVEDQAGMLSIYVDSIPILQGTDNRGLKLTRETVGDEVQISLHVREDNSLLEPQTGKIGQLALSRENDINFAIDTLDTVAGQLMFELNKLHSSGQAENGFDDLTSASFVDDAAAALDSTGANLDFTPVNGSFELHVTQVSTGTRSSSLINVDLNGVGGSDTTLTSLAAAIDATANVSASVTVDGRLKITSDSSDFEFSFAKDSSGALAALGLNTFFTGSDASDIDVNQTLKDDPTLLAVATDHLHGDNTTAEAIARMGTAVKADGLGGLSVVEYWTRHVEEFAVRTDQSNETLTAQRIIAQGLEAQRQSVSGVSVDEESINLLAFQRAYQGSARFIGVIDEVMQTLLSLVR